MDQIGDHRSVAFLLLVNADHVTTILTSIWSIGPEPSPRSACQMFPTQDGRIVVFAGYCKEKVKKKEVGVTLIDMFLLSPDKHDETGVKWRWQTVKQVRQQSACTCTIRAQEEYPQIILKRSFIGQEHIIFFLFQVGQRPSKRTGMCNTVAKDGRVFMFGGVMDLGSVEDDSDEDSDEGGGELL